MVIFGKKLKHPEKSHRKKVILPQDSVELAEFMGIMAGDGGVSNQWQFAITVNSLADALYAEHIRKLILQLFNLEVRFMERERHALVIVCSSVTVLEFLFKKGFTRGHKINLGITMPKWVKNESAYEKAFVRGLVDTDGCIFIHKHTVAGKEYRNLGLTFTSFAPGLVNSVVEAFQKNGIMPHLSNRGRSVYLYKEESVVKYLSIFGSSNPRIARKYEEWRGVRVA